MGAAQPDTLMRPHTPQGKHALEPIAAAKQASQASKPTAA